MSNVPRRRTLTFVLILALFLAALGLVAWTAVSSPIFGLTQSPVTPTLGQPFAQLILKKPTVTSIPLPTDSPIPVIPPTALPATVTAPTSESLVYAEIVADTPAPAGYSNTTQYDPSPAYNGNKYILVDISEQYMYVYEGDVLVNGFVSSTGMNNSTRTGTFSVLDKIPSAYGATWDIWMPNWLGIYWSGSMENGIHALPILPNGATLWAGYLGVPISYGCVVLDTYDAQWLYDWADIGMPVQIQW
jgi:lipoprotein-anchoring transpeptidase ErfK/SrfK